jgi:hypothetical protein
MLIDIMVTAVAADPAVALEPCDHLVPVGFQLQHSHRLIRKYIRNWLFSSSKNAQLITQCIPHLFAQGSECVSVRPDLSPGATTLHGVARGVKGWTTNWV